MESRLQMLQDRLRRQQMEADSVTAATVATGGTGTGNSGRWKSARPDKGSIRSYAKDVQDKHQRKKSAAENSSISSTNMRRSGSAKQQSNSSSVGEVSTAPARPSIQTKGLTKAYSLTSKPIFFVPCLVTNILLYCLSRIRFLHMLSSIIIVRS